MHVTVTCKYEKVEKQPRKKWRHCFFPITTLSVTIETSGWIWPNFRLIQALVYVINTCKYDKDPIKNSREKLETSFFSIISLWGFFQTFKGSSAICGLSRLKFKLVWALMHVTITCKYETYRKKNSREKVETSFSPL